VAELSVHHVFNMKLFNFLLYLTPLLSSEVFSTLHAANNVAEVAHGFN
jgi:hypothetical protein